MKDKRKTKPRLNLDEHPVSWFAEVHCAREKGEREKIENARRQLRRLGYAVELIEPEAVA